MAQWDARSYLAEAAAVHLMSIDANATATTIVNYYDAIAAHLETSDRHRKIASELEQQAPPTVRNEYDATTAAPTLSFSHSSGTQEVGLADSAAKILEIDAKQDETDPVLILLSGFRYKMPFRIMFAVPKNISGDTATECLKLVTEAFDECGAIFKPTCEGDLIAFAVPNPTSELDRINNANAAETIRISEPMSKVLAFAKTLYDISQAQFDPTVQRVAALWCRSLESEGKKPAEASSNVKTALQRALNATGFEKLGYCKETGTICKTHKDVCLDVSAISKGWCVDEIAARLAAHLRMRGSTEPEFLVEWGGDLRVAGSHPTLKRPWRVGYIQPPKLKPLFEAWETKSSLELNYLHAISLPVSKEGVAVATSGDYSQLHKWGHTHFYDPKGQTLLKVDNDSVAGAAILSPSCMVADGLATLAVLSRRMTDALTLIMRLRLSPTLVEDTPHVIRYYLYERNHTNFVHDEDDEDFGEGDAARLAQCDRRMQKDIAFQSVATEASFASSSRNTREDCSDLAAVKEMEEQERKAKQIENGLKQVMRCHPHAMCLAIVRPEDTHLVSTTDKSRRLPCHSVILSSVAFVPSPTSESPGEFLCLFNVMRGSILFNYTRAAGQTLGLHLLSAKDAHHVESMRHNKAQWVATVDVSSLGSGAAAQIDQLSVSSPVHLVTVRTSLEVGDHLVVLGNCRPTSQLALGDPFQALASAMGRHIALPVPRAPLAARSACGSVFATNTPAVLIARHAQYGRVGFPVINVRMCSVYPPMLTMTASCSCVTKGFALNKTRTRLDPQQSSISTHGCCLHFFSTSDDVPSDDADLFVRRNRHVVTSPETGPEGVKSSDAWYHFLPFPAFDLPKSIATTVEGNLIEAVVTNPNTSWDCEPDVQGEAEKDPGDRIVLVLLVSSLQHSAAHQESLSMVSEQQAVASSGGTTVAMPYLSYSHGDLVTMANCA